MKKHAIMISYSLLFSAVITSSLLYLLVDFKTYDVIPMVKSYGALQLILAFILSLLLLRPIERREKAVRSISFGIILWVLIIMQVVPALYWISFDGKAVAEYAFDNGVTGSWIYGAYHIVIIIWGIVNYLKRGPSMPQAALQ